MTEPALLHQKVGSKPFMRLPWRCSARELLVVPGDLGCEIYLRA